MVLFPGDEEMIHHDQPMDLEASRHGTALRTYQVVCGDFNSNLAMDTHLSNLLADHGLFLDWKYDHECIGYWVWNHVLVDHIFFHHGFPIQKVPWGKKNSRFWCTDVWLRFFSTQQSQGFARQPKADALGPWGILGLCGRCPPSLSALVGEQSS